MDQDPQKTVRPCFQHLTCSCPFYGAINCKNHKILAWSKKPWNSDCILTMVTLPSNSCFLPILTGTRSCWFHLLGLSGTCLSLPLKIRCLSLSLLGAAAKFPFIFLPALFLILCLPQHRCPTNFAKKRTFLSYHLIETLQWLHTSRKIKGPRLTTWFNPDFHNCFPCYIFIPYSKHTYPSPHHRDVIEHFHFLLLPSLG